MSRLHGSAGGTPASPSDAPDLQARLNVRIRHEWLISTFVLLALTFCLNYFGSTLGLRSLDNTLYDRLAGLLVSPPESSDIIMVAIDDASIQEIGQWPWRRNRHALLLEQLAESRAVALDVVFGEPNPAYPDDDAALARAIHEHGRVVLPVVIALDGQTILPPIPLLAAASAEVGSINIYPDNDGVVRSVSLQQPVNGTTVDHLSLALLEAGGHQDRAQHLREQYGTSRLNIVFSEFSSGKTVVPYNRVLDGSIPSETFRDKYVLVGSWSSGVGDIFATPHSSDRGNMPGVEVLANILNNGLRDQWIRQPGKLIHALLAMVPVLASMLAFRYLSPQRAFAFSLLVVGTVFVVVALLLNVALVWIPPSATLIGTVLAYPVWSWRSQHAALSHIDKELALLRDDHSAGKSSLPITGEAHATQAALPLKDQTLLARIRQLHDAIHAMREAHRHRTETLRFLSHDMRAPLNSILALTDLQRNSIEPERLTPETLGQFDFYATKTLALVDGFVALSRAEAIDLEPTPVDLCELIRQACEGAWVHARQKEIRIDTDEMPDMAWVVADAGLLERAWANLLDNALKYSDAGTTIHCTVRRNGDDWIAAIQDQGYGMDEAGLAAAFAPFVRVDEDRPDNPSGVGLGLAFVRTVVARHGGEITASSSPGSGTRFEIRLPAIETPADVLNL